MTQILNVSSFSYFSLSNCRDKLTAWLLDAKRFILIPVSMKLIISSSKLTLVLYTFLLMTPLYYREVYKVIVKRYRRIANNTEKYIKGVTINNIEAPASKKEVCQNVRN